ncbi:macro domain-containing protein [Phocaeicola paurosaccharolyticus]|uniref:macro domain-containing protein n=1 Tax=Phocaeicola paurosaccharolyticus TaxID=732242 RepID=UPI00046A26D7|nr:macro domain-containing protein [Phocaeicola paurosaccharolyticus]
MKFKVKPFDRKLFKNYLEVLSVVGLLCSFALIVITIPDCLKIYVGIALVLLLLIIYLIMWINANNQDKTTLTINNSTMIIKTGDIFEEDGLKVIAFNEYLDTQVDNRLISENTLNGKFLRSKISDIAEFDNLIKEDTHLNDKVIDVNNNRLHGKKRRYSLGTVFLWDEYVLTAFSKFDNENRAYLYMNDYISFLINFWNEIDIIYAGRSISIPLLGSGITRFKGFDAVTEQELLELLIWSFKVSRIKFTYPSKVSIIIHESKKDKINFYNLKKY